MNYRHIYHAGNRCDVVKHSVLALILDYLCQKEKGFAVLDTHAGCALYDLDDEKATKTDEAASGIKAVWNYFIREKRDIPPVMKPYFDSILRLNQQDDLRFYPGSPMLISHQLRQQDRLIACELHEEDCHTLRHAMSHDPKAQIHNRSGYEAVKALLPFPEKRGLVLIDPPFEEPSEFDSLTKAIRVVQEHMPTACMAIWYPIKDRPALWSFHEKLADLGIPKILAAEFIYQPEIRHDRLNGSGYIFMNPPWVLEEQIKELFPLLHQALATDMQGVSIKWIGQNGS